MNKLLKEKELCVIVTGNLHTHLSYNFVKDFGNMNIILSTVQ